MGARFSTITLWLFAAIGALASIVAIAAFFWPNKAQVEVDIYPNEFKIPLVIESVFVENSTHNGRAFINNLNDDICKNPKKSKSLDENDNKHVCDHINAIVVASDEISNVTSFPVSMYRMEVRNNGRSVAKGLRLSGSGIKAVNIFNESDQWIANEINESGAFVLPNLNPGENIKVYAWSKFPRYEYKSFYDFEKIPQITYEDGSASIATKVHSARIFSDIYDFLQAFPLFIQVIMVSFLSIFVSVPFLISVSIIDAIVNKKPLSSIFNTTADSVPESATQV